MANASEAEQINLQDIMKVCFRPCYPSFLLELEATSLGPMVRAFHADGVSRPRLLFVCNKHGLLEAWSHQETRLIEWGFVYTV